MTLAELQQAGPGTKIEGDLQLYVAGVKKIINNQHSAIEVQDSAGTKVSAVVFNLTAIQVGSWYVARQQIEPGTGPKVRYQQRGNYPASLAIDGSVFAPMPGAAQATTPAAAPPPAQAPPPPPAAAAQPPPPPPPASRPGALTDEQLLSAIEGWVKRLSANLGEITSEAFTAIAVATVQSMIVGAREGSIALAPKSAAQQQEEYWGQPPDDEPSPPF